MDGSSSQRRRIPSPAANPYRRFPGPGPFPSPRHSASRCFECGAPPRRSHMPIVGVLGNDGAQGSRDLS